MLHAHGRACCHRLTRDSARPSHICQTNRVAGVAASSLHGVFVYLPSNATAHAPLASTVSQSWRTEPSAFGVHVMRCFVMTPLSSGARPSSTMLLPFHFPSR